MGSIVPVSARSSVAVVVSAAVASAGSAGCMTRPRMCASESDCTAQASCVAGRCVAQGSTAAIDTARRLVFFPVDVAYVAPHTDRRAASTVTLGRTGDEGILLLRFAAPLPPEATVLEAYLVLERPAGIDVDPQPVVLHTVRIVEPWDSRSVRWATAPRTEEVGAPTTRVFPAAGPLVRLDVRPLVQRWRRRAGSDFGVAVEADAASSAGAARTTGVAVALAPAVGGDYDPIIGYLAGPAGAAHPFDGLDSRVGGGSQVARPGRDLVGPRLEVYVR
jgi:hypothetical protein